MTRTKKSKLGSAHRMGEGETRSTAKQVLPETVKSASIYGDIVLAPQHGAGVSQKKKKQKPVKRQQRLRKEKGVERAELVTDQLQSKISKSKRKHMSIKNRSTTWEDLNESVQQQRRKNRESKSSRSISKTQSHEVDGEVKNITDCENTPVRKDAEAAPEIELPDADDEMPGQEFLNAAGNANDLYNIE